MAGGRGGLEFLNQWTMRPSQVKEFQKVFQAGSLPIHLKRSSDIKAYKLVMWGCIAGIGYASYEFYQMALGKKKRSVWIQNWKLTRLFWYACRMYSLIY